MINKIIFAVKDLVDRWPYQGPVKAPEAGVETLRMGATSSWANVPTKWKWLTKEKGMPQLVLEGLKCYGIAEGVSDRNNPTVVGWADEVARLFPNKHNNWAADWYNKDSIPWCGLLMALLSARTNRSPVGSYLSALAWAGWQTSVKHTNVNNIWTGDVAVFTRNGGGHVGVIIGVSKDGKYVIVLGGNQDNAVNIKSFPIARLYAVRRPKYNVRPLGAKHRRISTDGIQISTYEG